MRDIVMYSGGKESLLVLKDSVDHGEDPTIIHVNTGKLSKLHERRVKTNAMRLYRTDAYYTLNSLCESYYAYWVTDTLEYGFHVEGEPDNWVDNKVRLDSMGKLHIGYWKRDNESAHHFIRDVENHPRGEDKYHLPLKDMTQRQILVEWRKLPDAVRGDTYSSTIVNFRQWVGEGHSVKERKHKQ